MQLVDEDDDLAARVGDLLQHRLQALLELAAELGAGHHGAEIERHEPLALQVVRHVAVDDALGKALGSGARRVGKAVDSTCSSRWSPYHSKTQIRKKK